MAKEVEGEGTRDEALPRAVHGYFVLQATAAASGQGAELSGVLEDLSTGAKRSFDSAAEMTDLMMAWAVRETAANRREDVR